MNVKSLSEKEEYSNLDLTHFNFLDLPHVLLDQIVSHLDCVRDVLSLASTCNSTQVLMRNQDLPGVRKLHLRHSVPSPSALEWLLKRCSSIHEVDANNCSQFSASLLSALSDLPIKVLKLNGCWQLHGASAVETLTELAERGDLETLDMRGTGISFHWLIDPLCRCRNLRELCLPELLGNWSDFLEDAEIPWRHKEPEWAWPSLKKLEFERYQPTISPFRFIKPKVLKSLNLSDCGGRFIGDLLYMPGLTEVHVSNAEVTPTTIQLMGSCNVESLVLSDCGSIYDNVLEEMAESSVVQSGRLKRLTLSNLQNPTSKGFKKILKQLASPLPLQEHMNNGECTRRDVSLDFSGCPNIDDRSFSALAKPATAPLLIRRLRLSDCWRVSHGLLADLAANGSLCHLQVMDLSHMAQLSATRAQPDTSAGITDALCAAVSAAGERLTELNLDGAWVGDDVLVALGQKCGHLETLSLIGCRPLTDKGLEAVARGCPRLIRLAVGGPSFAWREDKGLAAFEGLKHLTISRRTTICTDSALIKVLARHPQLEGFRLCMSSAVTDRGLEALPADSLRCLCLVACDAVQGRSLSRLTRLETLRLSSCGHISEEAVQAIAVSCKRLQLLELPASMPASCVPMQADGCGHLCGLRIEGGSPQHRKGLKRRKQERSQVPASQRAIRELVGG